MAQLLLLSILFQYIQGDHKKYTLRRVSIFYHAHSSVILRLVLESKGINIITQNELDL